jgi:hypothetical protein
MKNTKNCFALVKLTKASLQPYLTIKTKVNRQAITAFQTAAAALYSAAQQMKLTNINDKETKAQQLLINAKTTIQYAMRIFKLLKGRQNSTNTEFNFSHGNLILVEILLNLSHENIETSNSNCYCAFCNDTTANNSFVLKRCGNCRKVNYCGTECQTAHWVIHKKKCIQIPSVINNKTEL